MVATLAQLRKNPGTIYVIRPWKNLQLLCCLWWQWPVTYLQIVVLYGYETWSLTLREEHRLGVFENRVLRRIFGLKRD
jgi:hypothetical protein